MNILLITNSCSLEKYRIIERERTRSILGAQQKFFNFVINGVAKNRNVEIDVITILPVSASSHNKKVWKYENETAGQNVRYHYLGFLNGKITRYLSQYWTTRKFINKWIKNVDSSNSIILCDPLIVHASMCAQQIAKKKRIKTACIVTDIPVFVTDVLKSRFSKVVYYLQNIYDKLTQRYLVRYDAYILLTKEMNQIVNPLHKPYIIVEGIADSNINKKKCFEKKKICLYAGGIFARYGVIKLAEAFALLNVSDWEMHFYGTGNDVAELEKICEKHTNIKYMGTLPQNRITDVESEALLLINPRPSDEEYTKYSFPSKTTEYMSTGTATLSTRLPGIPEEYCPYLYWFDDETVEAMSTTISRIIRQREEELKSFGSKGQQFIIEHKGYISQGRYIYSFFKDVLLKDE